MSVPSEIPSGKRLGGALSGAQSDAGTFFQCPVCGSADVVVAPKEWVCASCAHEYDVIEGFPILVPDPERLEAELDEARDLRPEWYFDPHRTADSGPYRHHLRLRREFVARFVTEFFGTAAFGRIDHVLDLGCGDGANLSLLASWTRGLYASDYNRLRVSRARQAFSGPAEFFVADILQYPARSAFFDLVFCNHVLEHVPDDGRALGTMARLLKPGGLLVLGTPNEGAHWWRLAYALQPRRLATSDHVHFYTAATLRAAAERQGLRVIRVGHLGYGLPHWGLDERLRRHKVVHDALETIGRVAFPAQASSLYLFATK